MATPLRNNTGEPVNLQAARALAITPNDSADLTLAPATIYIGVAGDMSVITVGGDTLTFVGLAAGTILPVLVNRVRSTGTTATSLIELR